MSPLAGHARRLRSAVYETKEAAAAYAALVITPPARLSTITGVSNQAISGLESDSK
jgi:hypothetical protein